MSFNYSPKIVNDSSLILYLDASNTKSYPGAGTVWTDISKNNANTSLILSPTFGSGNGGNFKFNGTTQYVDIGDTPYRITNYNFTAELVFYYTGGTYTNTPLFGKRNSSTPFNQWTIGINNGNPYAGGTGNVMIAFLRDDNNPNVNNNNDRINTYTLPSAGIYHVVLTNSSSQSQMWVNGVLQSTSTTALYSGNFNVSGFNFRIGNYYTANYWNEKIYLCRFYNKTLSNSEITQNYNTTKSRFGLT